MGIYDSSLSIDVVFVGFLFQILSFLAFSCQRDIENWEIKSLFGNGYFMVRIINESLCELSLPAGRCCFFFFFLILFYFFLLIAMRYWKLKMRNYFLGEILITENEKLRTYLVDQNNKWESVGSSLFTVDVMFVGFSFVNPTSNIVFFWLFLQPLANIENSKWKIKSLFVNSYFR